MPAWLLGSYPSLPTVSSKVLDSDISGFPEIKWSSDNERLLILRIKEDGTRQLQIVDVDGRSTAALALPKETFTEDLCEWSPDRSLVSYLAAVSTDPWRAVIFVQDVQANKAFRLTSFEAGIEFCPIWLPSGK